MNSKTKILFLVFNLIISIGLVKAEEISKFPFIGLVEKSKVKIYAGPNENFEAISALEKGSKILVLGHSYGWYRLELPEDSSVYINKMFVERDTEDKGQVKGNRVNIRAGAGASFTILSQLNKEERVTIIGEDKEWFKIKPPQGLSGWVRADCLTFFSAVEEKKDNDRQKTNRENGEIESAEFFAKGTLQSLGRIINRPAEYKLSSNGQITYYIKPGSTIDLEGYVGSEVKVWGYIHGVSDIGVPIIIVNKIELAK